VETWHLIGEAQLARMKQGAILINTSRGGVVDGNALYESLHSGHLGGAALDVMELEPPPRDSPILALANVVVTPHMAGSTGEVLTLLARTMCEDILRVLQGHPPLHPVNPEVLSRLRPRAVDTR
jgi:D-3-phosphoglycerate dehydrogenase